MRVAVSVAMRGHPHDPPMTQRLPYSYELFFRLNREWNDLCGRPEALATARQWQLVDHVRSLDDVVRATGWYSSAGERLASFPDPAAQERVLAELLLLARSDDLAARVVLQRLLPGLVAAGKRWQRRHDGDAMAELLAAAWLVIRTFPVERRPHHLIGNLLRDCEYHAFRRASRRGMVQVPVDGLRLDMVVDDTPVEALHELVDVAAQTRDLTDVDRRLLSLLLSGHSTEQVAAALEVSERSVRNHKLGLAHRLRSAALAA